VRIAGDWNADGIDTPGVFRRGQFLLRNSNTPGFADESFFFGSPGDIPIPADWDGDGDYTAGVFRAGRWYIRDSNVTGAAENDFGFGNSGDTPLTS
jgi:hypothetical protein